MHQDLESTKQGVLEATAGLSEAQWNFKAGPDRWSVAEVAEHIAAAEGFLRGMILEKVKTAPQMEDFLRTHDDLRAHAIDSPLGEKTRCL
jgi:uncharacterized damage-inducible protein DinB